MYYVVSFVCAESFSKDGKFISRDPFLLMQGQCIFYKYFGMSMRDHNNTFVRVKMVCYSHILTVKQGEAYGLL